MSLFALLRRPYRTISSWNAHAQGVCGTDQIDCTVKGPESPTAVLIRYYQSISESLTYCRGHRVICQYIMFIKQMESYSHGVHRLPLNVVIQAAVFVCIFSMRDTIRQTIDTIYPPYDVSVRSQWMSSIIHIVITMCLCWICIHYQLIDITVFYKWLK